MPTFIPDVGKAWWTGRATGAVATDMQYIGWGTGSGQTESDTQLAAEDTDGRATGTVTRTTTAVTNDTKQNVGTITSTGTKTISEAGEFDAATEGTGVMGTYGDFTGIPQVADDSIEFTITNQVQSG